MDVNIVAKYASYGGKNMSKRNIKITNFLEKFKALTANLIFLYQ